jgi:hypothetical protein
MTATKPATSTPTSPISKKTVKVAAKKAGGSCQFGSDAAATEYNSIDTLLQGINTHRRYARRGSKTSGMLSLSASRVVFDSERRFAFDRNKLEAGVSEMTLVSALGLKRQKDSSKYLTRGAP